MSKTLLPVLILLLCAAAARADTKRRYSIRGADRVEVDDLEEAAARELAQLTKTGEETYAEDAAFEMRRLLLRRGFALSRVEASISDEEVVFEVKEGPRVYLGEISVVGSRAVGPDDLAAFVTAPTTWYFGLGSRLLVRGRLDSARARIQTYLRQNGYIYAQVRGPFLNPPLDTTAEDQPEELTCDVRYDVEDGLRASLTSLRLEFEGEEVLRDRVMRRLTKRLSTPFAPYSAFQLQSIVTDFYGEHGYPFAKATAEPAFINMGDRVEVEVDLEVETGPRVKVGRITIHGNETASDHAILRELEFGPGSVWDSRKIRESQRNLFELGLFRQAAIEIDRSTMDLSVEDPVVDLDLEIEETDRHRLEFTVGYGSWEKIRGSVAYTFLNLEGTGVSLTTELAGSTRGYRILGRLTDPWLIAPRIKGTTEVSREEEERPTFTYKRNALAATLSKLFAHQDELFLTYLYNKTDVFEVSGDLPRQFENETSLSSITVGIVSDSRVTKWDPRSGSRIAASLEWATERLGGEINFLRSKLSASHYLNLGGRWLVAARVEAGSVTPIGGTNRIPIQERYFLGGSQTVRSYKQDDLGPRAEERRKDGRVTETDAASGGEFYSLLNVELRFPLWRSLEAATFVDVGNIVPRHEDPWLRDYHWALGAGLRISTPVGPIRLDAGVNPAPDDDEDSWAIFLAVGYPF